MKRIFFLVFIVSGFIPEANAQAYPIPAPGSQWGELTLWGPPGTIWSGDYGTVLKYEGRDTILDGQTFQLWWNGMYTRYEDNKFLIRKKYRSESESDSPEILELVYYDFNLMVNDSFLLPVRYDSIYAHVTDVSHFTTLNGQSRKKIELVLDDKDLTGNFEWIEGIGDIKNGLFYLDGIMSDIHTRIVCFSDSSGYVFKDENFDYSCDEIESIEPFKIDAGKDTTICYCNSENIIRLGGNPTAFQVNEPVYSWKTINSLPASHFLDDTTIANPVINLENLAYFDDSVTFVLTVTDYYQNQKSDTVTIDLIQISQTLVYYNIEINKGDTLELLHNDFFGGVEPYTYYWSPDYNISDVHANHPKAWPDTTTRYSVYVIDSFGCKSSSDFVDVTVLDPSDVITVELNKGESIVFPNPVTNNSVLVFDAELHSNLSLKIVNANGAVIFNEAFSENPFQIGSLIKQSGIYFYSINEDSKNLASGKFVKL